MFFSFLKFQLKKILLTKGCHATTFTLQNMDIELTVYAGKENIFPRIKIK